MPLSPSRTVAELRGAARADGGRERRSACRLDGDLGAARAWCAKLDGLPLEHEIDEAGNQWWTLPGAPTARSLIGGHIDSVPNGGWLDGA